MDETNINKFRYLRKIADKNEFAALLLTLTEELSLACWEDLEMCVAGMRPLSQRAYRRWMDTISQKYEKYMTRKTNMKGARWAYDWKSLEPGCSMKVKAPAYTNAEERTRKYNSLVASLYRWRGQHPDHHIAISSDNEWFYCTRLS